jgi:hypothetical protein
MGPLGCQRFGLCRAFQLVAALEEGSRLVAHADNPAEARERAAQALDRLLLAFAADARKPAQR